MNTEKKYIETENLKHGYVYQIMARNARFGVWNEKKGEYLISRFKFHNNFTFGEVYWNMKGDIILPGAIKEVQKCPYDVNDFDEKKMLTYLNTFDIIKCSECGRNKNEWIRHEDWCPERKKVF